MEVIPSRTLDEWLVAPSLLDRLSEEGRERGGLTTAYCAMKVRAVVG